MKHWTTVSVVKIIVYTTIVNNYHIIFTKKDACKSMTIKVISDTP